MPPGFCVAVAGLGYERRPFRDGGVRSWAGGRTGAAPVGKGRTVQACVGQCLNCQVAAGREDGCCDMLGSVLRVRGARKREAMAEGGELRIEVGRSRGGHSALLRSKQRGARDWGGGPRRPRKNGGTQRITPGLQRRSQEGGWCSKGRGCPKSGGARGSRSRAPRRPWRYQCWWSTGEGSCCPQPSSRGRVLRGGLERTCSRRRPSGPAVRTGSTIFRRC